MKPQGRLGDKSFVAADVHGCPKCPHPAIGPSIKGSTNVLVNNRPALRVGDNGVHAICCGPNMWQAVEGSATVFINGRPAHRMGDSDQHCGGVGKLIEGSPNVLVGDSGLGGSPLGGECNQAQLRKDAAKAGTPFIEKLKKPLEIAKEAAEEMAKKAIAKMSEVVTDGMENAKKAAEEVDKDWELDFGELLKVESKRDYLKNEDGIEIGASLKKKLYDNQLLYYGNENANIKIGHAEADIKFGYGYDLEKNQHKFTLGNVKGKVVALEGEAKGETARGALEGSVKGEALSIGGEVTVFEATHSPDKTEVKSSIGAEANLVKGEAEGKVNITPKTIYDNTIGAFVGWVSPESKFKSAPDFLDHGIVIGAKGEAGIGAAAKAEAKGGIDKKEGVIYVEAEAKIGAGPMAGLKLFFGLK